MEINKYSMYEYNVKTKPEPYSTNLNTFPLDFMNKNPQQCYQQ